MTANSPLLLVDDSEDDIFLMKRAIQAAQINNALHVVTGGNEAIDYLRGAGAFHDRNQFPLPALILLDLKMPQKSGFEVLAWIREESALRTLVVIVLTTSRESSDIRRSYELGANSFLLKPSDTDTLAQMMTALKDYWLRFNEFHPPG